MNFKPANNIITSEEVQYLVKLGLKWCNKCKCTKEIDSFGSSKSAPYGLDSICKNCRRDAATNRRVANPERVKEIRRNSRNKYAEKSRENKKKWAEENRDHIRKYKREKYKNDPIYKMQLVCRQMVKRMFKSTGIKKCYKTQEVLGYGAKDLKFHIEKQFKEGMSWDNYGEWHIDHIIPISLAKTLEEGIILSKLENLQPLWAKENILKSNKTQ